MNSPPSIFAQPPESVPASSLDGPSHFESTEAGSTPFELPKHNGLPRSRASSVKGPPLLATPVSKQTIDAISKASVVTSHGLETNPRISISPAQNLSNPPTQWKGEGGDLEADEGKRQDPSVPLKRPALSNDFPGHSTSAPNLLKRSAPSAPPSPVLQRSKIPRISRDDSGLIQAFNPVDFAKVHAQGPTSPLFFSHTPHSRPSLRHTFNNGEAGSRLLEFSGMDDLGGGAVKTVKMARGSVGTMSPPSINGPPTSAHRTPSFQHQRHAVSRTPSSRGPTPELSTGDDRDRDALGGGMQTLGQAGVLELLDQDDRPTFILDLSYKTNFQPGPLYISFVNNSLRAVVGLPEAIRGRNPGDAPAFSPSPAFPEFKAWATSFVSAGEAMDVILPSFTYTGFIWRASTMKKRYRVVSGMTVQTAAAFDMPALSTPGASSLSAASMLPPKSSTPNHEEPGDYFGQTAAHPQVHETIKEHEAPVHASTSIETMPQDDLELSDNHQNGEEPVSILKEQLRDGGGSNSSMTLVSVLRSTPESPFGKGQVEPMMQVTSGMGSAFPGTASEQSSEVQYYFDWTRLPISPSLPRHIQFARSVDWASTSLGPVETWSGHLRATSCMIMASPHPAAMYWGEDYVAIYNEPYILLAGQKHPDLMGSPYAVAWSEIWENVKDSFAQAKMTGQSTMKDDDRLFINRSGFLEETYFSWSIIPLVGDDGSVVGLYNPAFEKTRRKIAERRMLTLREVGEKTAAAREVKSFWGAVLKALEYNEYDTPFVLLYSVSEEDNSDVSSIHSNSILGAKQAVLEGSLPHLPPDHPAAPPSIDLRNGTDGFAPVFRDAMMNDKHVLLETANGTLDPELLDNMEWRGFNEKPRAAVVSPIHPTTGESIIGFLVMGVNPRRPYDDDYNLFVTLLTRQLATSMASVVLFEEEIRRGQKAAKLAALDRIELSEQLAARTQEAKDSETRFTRMAEFAPVGIFIANKDGDIIFTNGVFHSLTHLPKDDSGDKWMELVKDEDKHILQELWNDVVHKGLSRTTEIRFQGEWIGNNGAKGEIWVLCSAYPEKNWDGSLMSIFGSLTDISQQKWAEGIQIKRTAEAIELKRQQSNFIDMTSHEMRNPLSAILQSADEIAGSLIEFKNSKEADQLPLDLLESNIDAAQTISLCANHQTRIVSDVLTLSKLDSALLLVTPVDVQPKVIVQQAMKMFEGETLTADIKLNLRIDKSMDELEVDWVRLDPSRLLQVLINLMTNAIKFTTPEAQRSINISLTAYKEEPSKSESSCVDYIPRTSKQAAASEGSDWGSGELIYLHFAVQDTGRGLTEDEKKLLFLRFSQTSPKTHVRYGGSGLGLFISRELVELQGGEIGVSSEAGKGSTFAFYVQARRSTAPSGEAESEAARSMSMNGGVAGLLRKPSVTRPFKPSIGTATPPRLASVPSSSSMNDSGSSAQQPKETDLNYLKILIVEDNLVNQKVLAKQLRNIGCYVAVANHGEEALTHLRKTKYWSKNKNNSDALELSVILMDLEMPVMDGLTCTRRIREMEETGELIGHSPIIAVSANARSAHVDSAMDAGMDDVVSKPFRIPELVPKMEHLVAQHRIEKINDK